MSIKCNYLRFCLKSELTWNKFVFEGDHLQYCMYSSKPVEHPWRTMVSNKLFWAAMYGNISSSCILRVCQGTEHLMNCSLSQHLNTKSVPAPIQPLLKLKTGLEGEALEKQASSWEWRSVVIALRILIWFIKIQPGMPLAIDCARSQEKSCSNLDADAVWIGNCKHFSFILQ